MAMKPLLSVCAALSLLTINGCATSKPKITVETVAQSLPREIATGLPGYPKTTTVYCNDALMKHATLSNSKVVIYLPIQRGRFYVCGQIAADFPVSTGRAGHDTPTGAFRILHKEECHRDYRGATYQERPVEFSETEVRDEYGIVRERIKKVTKTELSFEPFEWPWAMCLTWDGIYMYAHDVAHPGVRESGGCVRVPVSIQKKLFNTMGRGGIVYITRGVPQPDDHGAVNPMDVKYIPPQQ